jgi:hypothetical protein
MKHYVAAMLMGAAILAPLSYAHAQDQHMAAARAVAIHECSVLAGRYVETTWGSTEFYLYRSCMARHGEVE